MHGIGPVRYHVLLPQRVPDTLRVVRRQIDLETGLPGKAHPKQSDRDPSDMAFPHAHMRHRRDIDIPEERCQNRCRSRSLNRDHRPLFGHRCQPDPQRGELGLEVVLHMMKHETGAACGRRDMEPVGRQAGDDAIVPNETIFAGQNRIAAAAHRKRGEVAGIDATQKHRGVRPGDLYFA